jgi:hypothetical protein
MDGENKKDCSFYLMPGQKTRHIAGSFDIKAAKPIFEIEVSVPTHVRHQVEISQILLGTPEKCLWAWDIKNNSTWPAFVIIKKDGKKI